MNKKIIISTCVVVALIAIVLGVIFLLGDENSDDSISSTEASSEVELSTSEQPSTEQSAEQTTEQTTEPERVIEFDSKVTINKKEESYIEEEELEEVIDISKERVDSYDFSNGFVLEDSDNIVVTDKGFGRGELTGTASNASIKVTEEDPLSTNVQQLRLDTLSNKWFMTYYTSLDPLPITDDAEVVLNVGLTNYADYFEQYSYTDPTITEMCQILKDDVIDTAFGSALYLELYDRTYEMYYAYAFILCDRDRILRIEISDTTREYLDDYLLELTNDVVTLVK